MKKYYIYLISVCVFFSCSGKSPFTEIKDEDLCIQVSDLPSSDTASLEYKVRIIPVKESASDQQIKQKMSFNVDSCFYRYEGTAKQYPDGVIPIANGLKNCYEYVVIFSKNGNTSANTTLTYQDRFISGKSYQLSLN